MAEHDSKAAATRLEREIQDKMSLPPQSPGVRNINYDVHLGAAPQRPYASLEDQLGTLTNGWQSFEDLAEALSHHPNDGPIKKGDDGLWYRTVYEATDQRKNGPDGRLQMAKRAVKRAVALTREDAIAKSDGGIPTDYWNGFSWVRNGKKSERDFQVMAQAAAQGNEAELVWEDVDPMSEAVYRAQVARGNAPAVLVESEPPSRKKE